MSKAGSHTLLDHTSSQWFLVHLPDLIWHLMWYEKNSALLITGSLQFDRGTFFLFLDPPSFRYFWHYMTFCDCFYYVRGKNTSVANIWMMWWCLNEIELCYLKYSCQKSPELDGYFNLFLVIVPLPMPVPAKSVYTQKRCLFAVWYLFTCPECPVLSYPMCT